MINVIVILGLLSGLVGAVLVATELIPEDFKLDPMVQSARRDTPVRLREARRTGYPSPPYSASAVAEKLAEADERFIKDNQALDADIAAAKYADDWKRLKHTLWGLLFIASGSVLQGVAVLLQ